METYLKCFFYEINPLLVVFDCVGSTVGMRGMTAETHMIRVVNHG